MLRRLDMTIVLRWLDMTIIVVSKFEISIFSVCNPLSRGLCSCAYFSLWLTWPLVMYKLNTKCMHDYVKGRTFKTIHDFCTSVASEVKENKNYIMDHGGGHDRFLFCCIVGTSTRSVSGLHHLPRRKIVVLLFSPSRKFHLLKAVDHWNLCNFTVNNSRIQYGQYREIYIDRNVKEK